LLYSNFTDDKKKIQEKWQQVEINPTINCALMINSNDKLMINVLARAVKNNPSKYIFVHYFLNYSSRQSCLQAINLSWSLRDVAWWQRVWNLHSRSRVQVKVCIYCKSLRQPGFYSLTWTSKIYFSRKWNFFKSKNKSFVILCR